MTKPTDNLWKALLFAAANAFFLAGMSLFSKLLSGYFGPVEVTFLRSVFSLVVLILWFISARQLSNLRTERPWAHLFRAAIGTAGVALGMWALAIMPIAEVTILLFTSPLFTTILSVLVLKERIGPYRIAALIAGFAGVAIVANPFSQTGSHIPLLGLVIGLGWGFFSGAVDTCLRWMGTTEKSSTTTFYFMLFGTLVTALHLPFAEFKPGAFEPPILPLIAGLVFCGLLSLLAKTQSFRFGEATLVSPIMYTMILWAALFDYFFWNRSPAPNIILGGTIIIAANLFILHREIKIKKKTGLNPTEAAIPRR